MANGLPLNNELLSTIPGIESGDLALDLILHDLAERARQATGATGAAIALERGGALVCRAAAGSTVPDLGVEINIQSGLSGACVRENKLQWCSDTENDSRVDAAACRSLGVRSVVIVPLVIAAKVKGVFELFSSQPDAFRDRDIKLLLDMAQSVTDAVTRAGASPEEPGSEIASAAAGPPAILETAPTGRLQLSTRALAQRDRTTRILRGIAVCLAILLLVLLGLRWGRRNTGAAKGRQGTPAVQAADTVGSANSGTTPIPTALDLPAVTPKPSSGRRKSVTQNAALIARDGTGLTITRTGPEGDKPIDRETPTDAGEETSAVPKPSTAVGEPKSSANPDGVSDKQLAELASAPIRPVPAGLAPVVAPPSISVPAMVSNGVEEGRLVHTVQPKYPATAVQRHIEGLVVLHAVIGKDGSMRQLKSVRGDPLLTQAAIDAVRQWRYQPYKLDGVPVDMPIDITINFNMPK